MEYSSIDPNVELKSHEEDLGIDLPTPYVGVVKIEPGEIKIIDTGIKVAFPVLGKFRRVLCRALLGLDIVGVGGLLKPRSRTDVQVLAGVIDAGYRGFIKAKMVNPTKKTVYIAGSAVQMIPVLVINTQLKRVGRVDENTKRGSKGGINLVRQD